VFGLCASGAAMEVQRPVGCSAGRARDAMKGDVLIVEDELLIAMELENTLRRAGFRVRACVGTLEKALVAVRAENFDVAVLDCNLRGESVAPVAAVLEEKGKPFVFVSGYGRDYLPSRYEGRPLVPKPFEPKVLIGVVEDLLAHF
jgi:DNA-binding response OmpR family regulator